MSSSYSFRKTALVENYRSKYLKGKSNFTNLSSGTLTLINVAPGSAYSFLQIGYSKYIRNQLEIMWGHCSLKPSPDANLRHQNASLRFLKLFNALSL